MSERIGRQEPNNSVILPYSETEGANAIKLYEATGREAFPWQKALTYDILAVNESGLWVHSKFGYSIPRRNGKGEILVIVELYGLAKGLKILHTAHRTTTSHSAWERLENSLKALGLVKDKDYRSIRAKGQEYIELKDGGRIDFRTRTAKGGLGEGFDLLVIDEAQEYQADQETALKYVVTDSDNPLTLMCGTPPTPISSGTVFKSFRESVLAGDTVNAGWAEWSVAELSDIRDVNLWYECNPSLGLKLTERAITDELGGSQDEIIDFNIQRLGLWLKYEQKSAISKIAWDETATDKKPRITGKLGVGIKYNKDGTSVAVSVAVKTTDDKVFVETVGRKNVRAGTDWLVSFLKTIEPKTLKVVVDGANGQQLLADAMADAGLSAPVFPKVKEIIEANQRFENDLYQKALEHMTQPSVDNVVTACLHRAIGSGGGFGWKPINEAHDIAILDSLALANWAVRTFRDTVQQISY